jgi:hypothetical protein
MKFKPWQKFGLAAAIGTALIILLVWAFMRGHQELASEQQEEQTIKASARVSVEGGEVMITLPQESQMMGGLTVVTLEPATHREQLKAYGTILNLGDLVDSQSRLAAAQGRVQETQAVSTVSHAELARLQILHRDNRNISDKALQAATGKWRADRARAQAAQTALQALKGVIQQNWGKVISAWIAESSPKMARLARRQDLLLRITLPLGSSLPAPPKKIKVQAPQGTFISAWLISPAPTTDPRIQGLSYFYLAQASPHLLSGMNVIAYVPVGPQVQGVVVPSAAVVWSQGKAWVYLQKDGTRFIRQEVSTQAPVESGWFEKTRPSPGEKIVTQGAQLLLSEEFRAQIQMGD